MDYALFLLVTVVIINLLLGFFIINRNPKSLRNIIFSFFIISIAGWSSAVLLLNLESSYIFGKLAFAFASIIPATFFHFSAIFPKSNLKITRITPYVYFLCLVFLVLLFTPLLSESVVVNNGYISGSAGSAYPIFSIYFLLLTIGGLANFYRSLQNSTGIYKLQVKYVFLGIGIFSVIAATTNLLLPLVGIYKLNSFGPSFSIIMVGFISYAIIRHRLLDVRLVITRSLVYGTLLSLVTLSLIFITFLSAQLFSDTIGGRFFTSFIVASLIVFGLDPLKHILSRSTDKIFYKAKIDYNLLIQEISEGLSVEIDIDRIIENVSKSLQTKLKLKSTMIVLRQNENGNDQGFVTRTEAHLNTPNVVIASDGALTKYIEKNKISILEALERKIDDTSDERARAELEQSRQELEQSGAALVAPIIAQGKVNALLLLGAKLSGDSFGTEDIRLIEVISPQIASAIEKAKLYDEVKSFSERMKIKVEEATKELKERNVSLLTLQRITKDITRSLDFNKIVQNIADSLSTELGYLGGILVFLDDDGHTARARAITLTPVTKRALKLLPKPFEQFPSDLNDPKYKNMEAQVLRSGKMMVTGKIHDIICPPLPRLIADAMQKMLNVNTIIVIPILSEEKVIGVMEVGSQRKPEVVTQREIDTLQSIAGQLGIIYRNIKLFEQIRKANDELAEANTHLKQLDQAKSEFVSIASHQLRTPMTGIMGYLSMMTSGDFGKVKPKHQKILQNLLEESQRMIRLINLFLNVSKIEAGKFQINKTEIHIENLIEREIRELTKVATDKGLKLGYTAPKKPLSVILGDADKIQDVLLNLIDNAIKYTAKGSVTVTAEAGENEVRVNVVDTGIGIKPGDAKELFNKFVRGPQIAQIHPDGSGLGLFIAKSIIEGHSGKIWVESNGEGKGSTFSFTVPLDGGHHGTTVKI